MRYFCFPGLHGICLEREKSTRKPFFKITVYICPKRYLLTNTFLPGFINYLTILDALTLYILDSSNSHLTYL